MRILVTGARGMLGTDLVKRLSIKNDVIGVDIEDFDITDERGTIKEIKRTAPELVINTAAFTDVDRCESEREMAFKVNRDGAKNMALGCREIGAKFIHISTDYVFDGSKREPYTEKDEPRPINIYGLSKLEGEREILKLQTPDSRLQTLIIRTSWLFGRNGKNFVDTILKLAGERDEIRVVDDQVGSPTYTIDLSEGIERLIDVGATGIVHCSNSGECSWYDFAKEILRMAGEKVNVIPITTADLKRPAPRPPYSVLSNERYYQLTGHRLRGWEDGLRDYLTS
jgi:dTDP-4-dehydrorhamnose reductase